MHASVVPRAWMGFEDHVMLRSNRFHSLKPNPRGVYWPSLKEIVGGQKIGMACRPSDAKIDTNQIWPNTNLTDLPTTVEARSEAAKR